MGQQEGFTPPPPSMLNRGPMAPAMSAQSQGVTTPHPAQMGMQMFIEGMKHGFGAGVQHVIQQMMPQPMATGPMQQQQPNLQPGVPPNVPTQGPY